MDENKLKKAVREGYAQVAKKESSCCASATSSGCGTLASARDISKEIGYSEQEISAVPEGANLGLGCGNPVALAQLKEGDVVLDLGSGAGFDCFLAAGRVGPRGRVIGVDMTYEMLEKARENTRKGGYKNVEFRLGEIENLPVADNSVDRIISNCVINLAPDKSRVFNEAFRVLKSGGRVMVSDIVLSEQLPDFITKSIEAYVGCLSGAMLKDKYLAAIRDAGFVNIKIESEKHFPLDYMLNDATAVALFGGSLEQMRKAAQHIEKTVASVNISAEKP